MSEEELERLLNKMYYEYLDRDEAQKVIDYIINLDHQKQELINWLESKNNITLTQHKTIEPVIKVQEVIDKIKEVM